MSGNGDEHDARTNLGLFFAANVIAAPILGSYAWIAMEDLHAGGQRVGAIGVALLVTAIILVMNVAIVRRAARSGLDPRIVVAMWVVTVVTFVLPIGTGFFSPINFLIALLGG